MQYYRVSAVHRAEFMSLIFFLAVVLNIKSGEGLIRIIEESEDYNRDQKFFNGLRCTVAGPSNMKYEWYHNGTLIDQEYSLQFHRFDTGDLLVDKDEVNLHYQGIYQMFVSSSFGKIFGRTIRVKFKVTGIFEPPETNTEIQNVVIGQPYRLDCPKHSYSSGCLYKWGAITNHNGLSHIREYNNRVLFQNGTLFFSSVQERDVREFNKSNGGYSCILDCIWTTSHSSRMSHGILLKATNVDKSTFGPKIETRIEDREVLIGSEFVTFICAAAGSPTPSYRWVKITGANNTEDVFETADIKLGKFHHRLTIYNINRRHNGTYRCIATINSGNGTKVDMVQGSIIVREKPKWLPLGMITDKVADIFTNITWECKAYGDPKPAISWYANSTKMSSQIGRYEISDGRLTFSRLLVEDTGMYECVAENGLGYIYQTAALHVEARKPLFIEKNTSTVLPLNNDGVIKCRSNGLPPANNTWTKDGFEITFHKSEKYSILENQDLVINKVTNADAGVYECTARNIFGEDKRTIDVDIGDIKFVLTPQSYQNISKGAIYWLMCKAESSFKIKYKWRFDGNDLIYDQNHIWSSDDNKLVVQNASELDSGKYECVAYIDDPVAKLERSRSAFITVEGPPRMLKGFHLLHNCTNSSAILVWQLLSQYNNSKTYVVIEWRTSYDNLGLWRRSPETIDAVVGTAEVKNLPSWAKIQFRAIAQNSFGFGKSSAKTRFEKCETPPAPPTKCPEDFHAVPGPLGKLKIKWKRMTALDFNAPGFNYTIKFRPSGKSSTWEQVVLDRLKDQFTILNAGINQLWDFTIQTRNNEGFGPLCQHKTSYSGQLKPGAISKLMVKDIRTTSVLVTWIPPPLQNGTVEGYKLEYWSTQSTVNRKRRQLKKHPCRENNLCKLVVLEGRSGEHRIINLSLMTHYNVSLRGFNSAGEGPRRYSMFHTAFPISEKLSSSMYEGDWFIAIVSIACALAVIAIVVIHLRKRSERYPVRKREEKKGLRFRNLEDDPAQVTDLPGSSIPIVQSNYPANESNVDEDSRSLTLSAEDKYDDGGSFIGEYGGERPPRKYEEMFV